MVVFTIVIVTIVFMNMIYMHPYLLDTLMRDLVGHYKKPSAFVVFLYLWYRSAAQDRSRVPLSLQSISNGCGLSKSSVQLAVRYLCMRKLIAVEKSKPTAVPRYTVNEPWRKRSG
jgi:hypothetical protein